MTRREVGPERLAELRGAVRGPVLTPDNSGYDQPSLAWLGFRPATYDQARALTNGLVDSRPSVIVQCMGVADVQEAVRFARTSDLRIAVKSGGHSPSRSSAIQGGLLIDMSLMRGVQIDKRRGIAVAGAGTLLGEFDRETQAQGLICPSGAVSHTGLAGLTLYGGVGRIMRKFGLTLDNVIAYDIVTADGEWRHVDADQHADLYWALRGGGGQFGVVTHFHYKVHELGPMVYGGFLGWPLDQAKEVFQAVRDVVDSAPDELQCQYLFVTGPPTDILPASLKGKKMLLMTATWASNDFEEGERVLKPLRELIPPVLDGVGPVPYTFLQTAVDAMAPHGRLQPGPVCGYFKTVTEEIFDTAISLTEECPGPFTVIELSQMGGAISRVPVEATAAGAARAAGWLYIVGGNTWERSEIEPLREWIAKGGEAYDRVRLPGRYLNFVGDDSPDTFREAFEERTFGRLQVIKAKYDPHNVFSYNPNRVVELAYG